MGKGGIISAEIWRKIRLFISPLIFNIMIETLDHQARERNKGHPIRKEGINLSFFKDDIILYLEKPTDFIKKLELVNSVNSKNIKSHTKGCSIFAHQ